MHPGRGPPGQDPHMKYLRASRGLFLPLFFSHVSSPFPCLSFQILRPGGFPNISFERRFLPGSLAFPRTPRKPAAVVAFSQLFGFSASELMPWVSRPPRAEAALPLALALPRRPSRFE